VVDAGALPVSRQVGLTGHSLAPDIAVLLGVRGATNHLIGWRRARALVAVDLNRAAPVFDGVDAGIVGDWAEVLPFLEPALRALSFTPS
jgi:electron transfer flavoprotein alpha subunit